MNEKDLPGGGVMRHLVRSRSELQGRVTELIEQQTAISEVLRAIANSPHDLQPIFDAILDSSTRLCRADVGTLRLSEESGLRLVAMRGDPLLVSHLWSSFPALAEKGSLQSLIATSRLPSHIPDLATLEIDHRDDTWITAVNAGYRATPVQTAVRNCTKDEGRPFGFGDQVADPKPPRAAAVKSRGGERRGNAWTMIQAGMVERGERKQTASEASKAD